MTYLCYNSEQLDFNSDSSLTLNKLVVVHGRVEKFILCITNSDLCRVFVNLLSRRVEDGAYDLSLPADNTSLDLVALAYLDSIRYEVANSTQNVEQIFDRAVTLIKNNDVWIYLNRLISSEPNSSFINFLCSVLVKQNLSYGYHLKQLLERFEIAVPIDLEDFKEPMNDQIRNIIEQADLNILYAGEQAHSLLKIEQKKQDPIFTLINLQKPDVLIIE